MSSDRYRFLSFIREHWGLLIAIGLVLLAGILGFLALYGQAYGLIPEQRTHFFRWFGMSPQKLQGNAIQYALLGVLCGALWIYRHRIPWRALAQRLIYALLSICAGVAHSLREIAAWPGRVARLPTYKFFAIGAANLGILGIALLGVELAVRHFVQPLGLYDADASGNYHYPGQYSHSAAYLMLTNEPSIDAHGRFPDRTRNTTIEYSARTNKLGFRMDRELSSTEIYRKAPNEKVVLVLGSSPVWGFGSTSNETTIAGYLQNYLNAGQDRVKYTVFNFGNGAWNAYQQFLALNLYGMNLDPDWIVTMDGHNDIYSVATDKAEEIGVPDIGTNFLNAYFFRAKKPDLLRGRWENWLVTHSAAYRLATGKTPIRIEAEPGERRWDDVEKAVDFYIKAQRSILRECQSCRYILSTQPVYGTKRHLLSDTEMAEIENRLKNQVLDPNRIYEDWFSVDLFMYMQGRIIARTEALCATEAGRCTYQAMDRIYPADPQERKKYFTDGVHMVDEGYAIAARWYADRILAAQ